MSKRNQATMLSSPISRGYYQNIWYYLWVSELKHGHDGRENGFSFSNSNRRNISITTITRIVLHWKFDGFQVENASHDNLNKVRKNYIINVKIGNNVLMNAYPSSCFLDCVPVITPIKRNARKEQTTRFRKISWLIL